MDKSVSNVYKGHKFCWPFSHIFDKNMLKNKDIFIKDIKIYEQNKNRDKIQIYLLTDNSHYNFLEYEEDHLETLELNKDGNFTDNLLNYLDGQKTYNDDDEQDDDVERDDEQDDDVEQDVEQDDDDDVEQDGNTSEIYISSDNDDGDGDSKRCEKCKTRIKSLIKFTSKNFNEKTNKIETIYFCSIECFKNFENWIK